MRDELGLLVDFMAELFKNEGHVLIGISGMPELVKQNRSLQVVCVLIKDGYLLSSTLLKQTVRNNF